MHVEICDVSCVLVKTVKTQKQIKYKKKKTPLSLSRPTLLLGLDMTVLSRNSIIDH